MIISVVCPVYNEEKYIEKLLLFYKNAVPADKELFLIDGGSTDRTREIIMQHSLHDASIVVLDNPKKFVPFRKNNSARVVRVAPPGVALARNSDINEN